MDMRWAAGVLLVVPLAACGGSDDSGTDGSTSPESSASQPSASSGTTFKGNGIATAKPAQAVSRSREAAKNARSVQVTGTAPDASLKVKANRTSSDSTRTSGDVTIKVRTVGNRVYIKADKGYWTEAFNAKKAKKIGDKWVTGTMANPQLKAFRETATTQALVQNFVVKDKGATVGAVGEIEGRSAVPVESTAGTLWIAATGRPYPLQIESAPAQGEGSVIVFSGWNRKVVVKAPPPKNTIDLADLA